VKKQSLLLLLAIVAIVWLFWRKRNVAVVVPLPDGTGAASTAPDVDAITEANRYVTIALDASRTLTTDRKTGMQKITTRDVELGEESSMCKLPGQSSWGACP